MLRVFESSRKQFRLCKADTGQGTQSCWLGALSLALLILGLSTTAYGRRSYGSHSGYLADITGEREMVVKEVMLFLPPEPDKPMWKERIFDERLSREFVERYEQKFGRTEQQRDYNISNRYTYIHDGSFGFRGTEAETNIEERKFGEFMFRRLTEYHVESYAKSDPTIRPVWDAKERLSQVKMEVGPRVKINAKYSISGNSADIVMHNPWVLTKVVLQFGGGGIDETIFSFSRALTRTVSAETHYYLNDGIVSVIGRKALLPNLGFTLTTSTYTTRTGVSPRESLGLAGLSYTY